MLQIEHQTLNRWQLVAGNLILFLVCLLAAQLGLWLAVADTPITVFWPPAGLALAAVFRYGKGLSIGAWLGAFNAGLMGLFQSVPSLTWPLAIGPALIIATGALAGLLAGQELMTRIARGPAQQHVRQVALLMVAGLLGAAVSATAGTAALYFTVLAPGTNLIGAWLAWWVSCSLGVFLFTPLLLAWWGREEPRYEQRQRETVVCLILLTLTTYWAFLSMADRYQVGTAIGFIVLPFLTWAALRLGYRATTTGLVIFAFLAVLGLKQSPLPQNPDDQGLLLVILAARLLCLISTTLCITAVVRERLDTERLLHNANQNLEAEVGRRTQSLKQLTEQLQNEVAHQKQTAAALRESQERLELAVRAASIGYWDSDLIANTVHYSPEWKAQLGYQPEELPGNFGIWRELLHPEDRAAALARVNDYLEGRTTAYVTEFRLRHKDGSYRWIHSRGNLIKDSASQPVRLIGCHLDITARKRTEAKLEAFALLGKQLSATNTMRDAALLILQNADRLLGWDCGWLRIRDDEHQQWQDLAVFDLINGERQEVPTHPEAMLEPSPIIRRVMEAGPQLLLFESDKDERNTLRLLGNGRRSLSVMFVPIHQGDRLIGMVSVQSYRPNAYTPADLETLQTLADHCGGALERLQTTAALRVSEERFRLVWETAADGMRLTDAQGRIVAANDAFCRMMGQTRGALEGQLMCVPYAEPDRARMLAGYRKSFADRKLLTYQEGAYHLASGQTRWLEIANGFIEAQPNHPLVLGVFRDVTARKQTEETLRQNQEQLTLAARAAQIGFWDWDLRTGIVHFSPEWKNQLGLEQEQIPGSVETWRELLHPGDRAMATASINDYLAGRNPEYAVEFRLRHKDGTYRWIYSRGTLMKDAAGKPYRILGCHLDITKRKRLDFQLEAFALLGKQLSAANTVREAARLIVDIAEALFGWDAATLVMFDEKTGLCRPVLDVDLVNGQKADVLSIFYEKEPSPRMRRTIEQGAELILRAAPVALADDYRPFGDQERPSASMMYVPVRDSERTVGMLSVQSYRINVYTPADLDTLQALADHCGGALARIRSREIQRESELGLASAQLQAKLGSWEFSFHTRKPQWSHGMFVLFDRDPVLGPLEFDEFIQGVAASDREKVTAAYQGMAARTDKQTFEFDYTKAQGVTHHFVVTLECLRDHQGNPLKAAGVVQDITERKAAERALRESSERLQLALEVARMGTWELDLITKTVHADLRLVRMFGGPTTRHLSTPEEFKKLIHPEDLPPLRAASLQTIADAKQFHERFRVVWPDGSHHWLEAQGSLFRNHAGQPQRMVGVTVDITERHQAEVALRESEQQYAELVNNIDGIVWEADVRTLRMTFVSHQSQRILGYPASDWTTDATFWQDHIHPDDREAAMGYCAARTTRGEDHSFEYRMLAADGREVWLADFVTVIMDQGRPVTLRGVMVDITRRKELELEQARAFSLLQTTIESSEDGLLVVDRTGRVRVHNQRFVELWSIPLELLVNQDDQALLDFVINQLTQPENFLAGVTYLYEHPDQESFDVLTFKDGRIYERYSRPQRLNDEIVGRVWSFRDVTERRSNEWLVQGQARILESIATGRPLNETLAELCHTAENASPEMICSVLLVSADGQHLRHGAAPSLPEDFCRLVDGIAIGPKSCSCGTCVHREATVIVEDIAADPLWEDFKHLALPLGLRACWSTPIFNQNREVVGTLAFYYPTPKRPTVRERRIIEMATHTAAIAILKHHSDEQLARSAQILRQLSGNLLEAHEAERRHLARELHDELGQTLTATKILLESLTPDQRNSTPDALPLPTNNHTPLGTAISHVETMLQQVRTLSLSLRPTILDDCGLPAALRWLLDQHTKTTGRPVSFELKQYDGAPEPAIETACFRIAQEALTNISRHSHAHTVNVELQCDAAHLTLVVRDDGVGFDVTTATLRAHAGGSVGLLGQQERAALLGGRVEINSRPGTGTEIRVWFPVNPAKFTIVS